MSDRAQQLEAILFWKAESVPLVELARMLKVSESQVREGLSSLESELSSRGIALLMTETAAELRVAPSEASFINALRKEELTRDLGKAGAEVLALVLYASPLTRARVDYIRGVDSTFTLRMLTIRGLIEREVNPQDERSFIYRPTTKLLAHLGLRTAEELPDYQNARAELTKCEAAREEEKTEKS